MTPPLSTDSQPSLSPTSEREGLIADLLRRAQADDDSAQDQLYAAIYDEMRQIARTFKHRIGKELSCDPTELANDSYTRLVSSSLVKNAPDRHYLFASIARSIRNVIVDRLRARHSLRVGGDFNRRSLDEVIDHLESTYHLHILDLHDALEQLAQVAPRQAQVVEMKFFGGYRDAEIAAHLSVSVSTVESDFRKAREWLTVKLK